MYGVIQYANSFLTGKAHFGARSNIQSLNRSISGKLVYQDDKLPDADVKIHVFAKDLLGVNHFLGKTKTDRDGNFNFRYNWSGTCLDYSHRLVLAVVDSRRPFASKGFHGAKTDVVVDKIEVTLPVETKKVDLGTKHVTYGNMPSDLTKLNKPPETHMHAVGYYWKLFKAVFPEAVKSGVVYLFQNWISTASVQKFYDSFGPQYPKTKLTPDALIDELLNKICATDYVQKGDRVTWTAVWDGFEMDQVDSLPNVQVDAKLNSDEELKLESISIQFRGEQAPQKIYFDVPVTEAKSNWAIYVALSTFALKGEAEIHLAEGHVLPGIPAKTFFKYIKPSNPIYKLLAPHLGQLDFINWLGSMGIIFGKGSVLDVSALNEKSIAEVILKFMILKADYLGYSTKKPICKNHYHAIAEEKYFNLLFAFFEKFVEDHWVEISKSENWEMICRWSTAMNKHFSAIPQMTQVKKDPNDQDKANLVKFMAWLVSKTTFLHWAAHSRQALLTGSASMNLQRKGKDNEGNLAPFGNTPAVSYSKQLFNARSLLNFDGDAFLQNPYGDMHPELLAYMKKHLKNFKGYEDIAKMHITTQI